MKIHFLLFLIVVFLVVGCDKSDTASTKESQTKGSDSYDLVTDETGEPVYTNGHVTVKPKITIDTTSEYRPDWQDDVNTEIIAFGSPDVFVIALPGSRIYFFSDRVLNCPRFDINELQNRQYDGRNFQSDDVVDFVTPLTFSHEFVVEFPSDYVPSYALNQWLDHVVRLYLCEITCP